MSTSTPLSAGSGKDHRKVSSPYGFSMHDVEATQKLESLSRAAQDIVRAHGFERVMPAMVDYPETFSENSHAEIFEMKDNSGERLALRNDITAQVIKGFVRQIENKQGHTLRKFYYAAPVYKDVRKNYPSPREIYQIGCEVVGEGAEKNLGELLALSHKLLSEVLELSPTTAISDVRLREVFSTLLGREYLLAERRRDVPLMSELLATKAGLSASDARSLALWLFYPGGEPKPIAISVLPPTLQSQIAAAEKSVGDYIAQTEKQGIRAYWQPLSEPRSGYYSSIFFETFVKGFTEPLVRGGVYNDLIKRYANIDAGACGFALDLLTT